MYLKFAPELLLSAEVAPAPVAETALPIAKPEDSTEALDETPVQEEVETAASEVVGVSEESDEALNLEDGIIKAPKVELRGLTVLGKIELPGAKKKEYVTAEISEEAVNPEVDQPVVRVEKPVERRPKHQSENRRGYQDRPRRNPVTAQREREQREAEEQKKEEALRQKEKRTQYYQSRVKPAVPTKAARIFNEQVTQDEQFAADKPKTLWGKFVRWLTT